MITLIKGSTVSWS